MVECRGEEGCLRKKEAHKAMYQNSTEENKRSYKSISKKKKKVSKAMREKAQKALTE